MILVSLVEFRPVRFILVATLVGAGKAAEHGSIVAGLVALVAFGLLEPRLPLALADGCARAVAWAWDRLVR
jgi:hypothetical protein